MTDERVNLVIEALLSGEHIDVCTRSRSFSGRVWEVGRSPYDGSVRARVADHEGRVHYFRVDRPDALVRARRTGA